MLSTALLLLIAFVGFQASAISVVEPQCYADAKYNIQFVSSPKVLIVTTSHGVLGPSNCTTCKKTGVIGEEFTAPFLTFTNAKMDVTLASIKGGQIPIDPQTFKFGEETSFDKTFFANPEYVALADNSPSIADLDFLDYDAIYMAGGWGAAWDLGTSTILGKKITEAYAHNKLLGSVCHGSLGFILATKPDGSNVCNGTVMTGVTDRQIKQLGVYDVTPEHPEDELKEHGAIYKCKHGVVEWRQNYVVTDGNIVTGQNQMASCQVPQLLIGKLAERLSAVVA